MATRAAARTLAVGPYPRLPPSGPLVSGAGRVVLVIGGQKTVRDVETVGTIGRKGLPEAVPGPRRSVELGEPRRIYPWLSGRGWHNLSFTICFTVGWTCVGVRCDNHR